MRGAFWVVGLSLAWGFRVRTFCNRLQPVATRFILIAKIDNYSSSAIPTDAMTNSRRTTKGRGVSLPSEVSDAVDSRIAQLKPWVRGFSEYVQQLIRADLTHGVIQEEPANGLGKSGLVAVS